MMQKHRLTAALVIAGILAGCSGLLESDSPPNQAWWLKPPEIERQSSEPGPPLALQVTVVPGLDTDKIQTLSSDARLNYYSGARWTEHLPELLESLLYRSIDSAGIFSSVRLNEFPSRDECMLTLEARRFYSLLDADLQTDSVEIEFHGHFTCENSRTTLHAERSESVNSRRMPLVVAAYQRGVDEVIRDIIEQLADD